MIADTEIAVAEYTFDELPVLEHTLAMVCDKDPSKTTTVEFRSGESVPHTTIRFSPEQGDANQYHVLWWVHHGGDELFRTFQIEKGDSTGYGLIVRVLGVIDGYKEGAK